MHDNGTDSKCKMTSAITSVTVEISDYASIKGITGGNDNDSWWTII